MGYGIAGGVGVGVVALAGARLDDQDVEPTTDVGNEFEISVEDVVRVAKSRYEVTFGYSMPDDATIERSRFVTGNASDDPPRELRSGRHTFTVVWTPEDNDERLVWEVRLAGADDSVRAATMPLADIRKNWTLNLEQLQEKFERFDHTDITVTTDSGSNQSIRMSGGRGEATFTVWESGDVTYQENGAWWKVTVDPSRMMPPTMGDKSDGFGGGRENDHYTFTMTNSPYDGSQRMAHVLSKGDHWGANMFYYFPNHGLGSPGLDPDQPDEVYSRIRVRFDPEWEQRNEGDTCKIYWAGCNLTAGPAGSGGYAPTGDDGWSVRIYTRGPSDDGSVSFGSYVYHLDQDGPFGTLWDWSAEATIGEWHEIDSYVRLNSVIDDGANRDGVVRMWLNGTLQDEHTNLRWRTTEDLGFDRLGPGSYWGGSEVSPRDNTVYYDDYRFNVGSESL